MRTNNQGVALSIPTAPKRQSRPTVNNNTSSTPGTKINYKREIVALDFLLGIPMKAERYIVHQGWLQQHGLAEVKERKKVVDEEALELPHSQTSADEISSSNQHGGRWWEKWKPTDISRQSRIEEEAELEQPNELNPKEKHIQEPQQQVVPLVHAPGKRLQGDDAINIQIPLKVNTLTLQRSIARMAVTREWELQVAHGIRGSSTNMIAGPARGSRGETKNQVHPPMLDGRLFFSAGGSYPAEVFSIIKYEPRKEEAARRRQKLEARGGGGSQFIMPARDWRGISYRSLLKFQKTRRKGGSNDGDAMMYFDRFATSGNESERPSQNKGDKIQDANGDEVLEIQDDDNSDEEVDTYVAGLLDDPEMVLGRHRNVMIGDRTTGCIVSSTISFVKPKLLKADLNKQFRERFEGWEPPKSQRKYIGARVIDGIYTLLDLGIDDNSVATPNKVSDQQNSSNLIAQGPISSSPRKRQNSTSSIKEETIRMPPSLTLSKIRSLKQQALHAAVKARLEISTVALAIVYFERLCLNCRVDKSNRRLSFAACLLLAIKINEAHVGLVMTHEGKESSSKNTATTRIQSLYRPTKKSSTMFASLLEFFTQEWDISLKHLFAAEWGVFAALQFRLSAQPSQVSFHFKRLLKSLNWNPRRYLGAEMFTFWQQALAREEYLRKERDTIMELRQQQKEKNKLMQLQREIGRREKSAKVILADDEIENIAKLHVDSQQRVGVHNAKSLERSSLSFPGIASPLGPKRGSRLSLSILNRFGGMGKRSLSTDKLQQHQDISEDNLSQNKIPLSPSMPTMHDLLNHDVVGKVACDDQAEQHFIIDIQQVDGSDDHKDRNNGMDVSSSDHSETSIIMI